MLHDNWSGEWGMISTGKENDPGQGTIVTLPPPATERNQVKTLVRQVIITTVTGMHKQTCD